MLTANQYDAFTDQIMSLYTEYEDSVIVDIARRLGKLDLNSAAWQVQRLSESGMLYDETLKKLAALTHKSESELHNLFEQAGVKAMKFDDTVYKAAGLNPLPLNLSPAMAQVLAAGLRKTNNAIQNLTMTTAMSSQQAFVKSADLAYMQVSTGAMSYNQAITQAVKKMADQGLSVVHYSGRTDQMDVAIRRTVLTGVAQTTGNLQLTRADEMGCDLVETSAHAGARPTHAEWQGKVFSRSGTNPKYGNFVEETGYGEVDGLCGINCRHSFYPYFEGISEPAYTEQQLNELSDKTVTYNGQEMSQYDATQYQRVIERKIRYWKRQEGALKAAGIDATSEKANIQEWQAKMRDFLKQTNLPRQSEREQIGFYPNLSIETPKINFKSTEYQKVAELGNVVNAYPSNEPGLQYVTQKPVMYTGYTAQHLTDEEHRSRITWLEKYQNYIVKAIQSPEYIERNLRYRHDEYYSATSIVELPAKTNGERQFMGVAISLSKENNGNGFHQITTIHPLKYRDLFDANGNLKPKYKILK